MRKYIFLTIILVSFYATSQQERTIVTAVPFLNVAADARASGMADMGVATPVDAFSQQWNPSKYAFAEKKNGFWYWLYALS